jgi:hypothetical protein
VRDACDITDIDIHRNLAVQVAMGLPMPFAANAFAGNVSYISTTRTRASVATKLILGYDLSKNTALVVWRHAGTVANMEALRQLATSQLRTLIGQDAVMNSFASWNAPSTADNSLEVTFSIYGSMRPTARANAIASTLLGTVPAPAASNTLPTTDAYGVTGPIQHVRAHYVRHSNGQAVVAMAVSLVNEEQAFNLAEVASGTALADYLDYSMKQCEVFKAPSVSGKLDFLFVVDDSPYLASVRLGQLANAVPDMVKSLEAGGLNEWRAALVTSSYLRPGTTAANNKRVIRGFTNNVDMVQSWLRPGSTCTGGTAANRTCLPGSIAYYSTWTTPPACGTNLGPTPPGSLHYGLNSGCYIGITGDTAEGMLGSARLAFMNMSDASADPRIKFRDDARVVIILFTNAEDKTSGMYTADTNRNRWEPVTNFVNFFAGANAATPKGIAMHAVYCPPGRDCGNIFVQAPSRIQTVVNSQGGLLAETLISGDLRNRQSAKRLLQGAVTREILRHQQSAVRLQNAFIAGSLHVTLQSSVGFCQTGDVPRSRVNGYDYDVATRTLMFFGDCRPMPNSDVVVAYRTWEAWTPDDE